MKNPGETKPVSRLIIEVRCNKYVMTQGGSGVPIPNSVGTEQIIDGAVEMEDLHDSVKDAIVTGEDRVTQEDVNNFEI